MESAEYDASVLQAFADELYRQARKIVIETAVRYGLLTLLASGTIAAVAAALVRRQSHELTDLSWPAWTVVLVLTAAAVAKGISDGRAKSFALRLEAQRTLCQIQIELNTRR